MATSKQKPDVMDGALTFGQFYALESSLSAVKHINGTSLTIPGQARDLGALLASSKYSGGMIPRHGTPQYDESFEHGFARVQAEGMDDEELSEIARRAIEEDPTKKEPATPPQEPPQNEPSE